MTEALTIPGTILDLPVSGNEKIILARLSVKPEATNRDLARLAGLTESAVEKILRRLCAEGYLAHAGRRRARQFHVTFSVERKNCGLENEKSVTGPSASAHCGYLATARLH